jgi:cytidine deaminase
MCTQKMYKIANQLAIPFKASNKITSGDVGAVILAANGEVYTGVSIASPCGLGFCAEHSAIASMLQAKQSQITAVIAVDSRGEVFPPCGRCRQLMLFLDKRNQQTQVSISKEQSVPLSDLLPYGKGC